MDALTTFIAFILVIAFYALFIAWFTVLPTLGLLWSIGWLP